MVSLWKRLTGLRKVVAHWRTLSVVSTHECASSTSTFGQSRATAMMCRAHAEYNAHASSDPTSAANRVLTRPGTGSRANTTMRVAAWHAASTDEPHMQHTLLSFTHSFGRFSATLRVNMLTVLSETLEIPLAI
eukprot:365542-Chlamydomonas_euryale.AAC.14